jgi:hypothetical protein
LILPAAQVEKDPVEMLHIDLEEENRPICSSVQISKKGNFGSDIFEISFSSKNSVISTF